MKKILFYSFLVGTAALILSVGMIMVAVPLLGDTYQKTMFVNSVIGCYSIGTPVTYYCLRQGEKLKIANAELDEVRRKLEASHRRLEQKVRIDQMTGLLNREYFFDEMKERRNESGTTSLLLIDADHFKVINDEWGHPKGDEALKKITAAIQESVREGDVVGRIGGEEFAVFLPGAATSDAEKVAERIRQTVENIAFAPAENTQHPLSVSIGGVVRLGDADLSRIMTTADRNLYKAKNAGRNQSVIGDELQLAA